MEVLVAGGGIAGLSIALTCHRIGVPVTVFESAHAVRPLGLGINLQPSAVRALHELGLGDELAGSSVPTSEVVLVGRDGRDVFSEPRGLAAGSRWPQLSIQRGQLEMLLYRAVVDRLGPDAVRTGRRVTGYEHTVGGVVATVTGPEAGVVEQRVPGTVLVAADGLHSAVRAQMFPGEGGPRWGGSVLWRGLASGGPVRGGESFVVVGDEGQRFMVFPLSPPDPVTGIQQLNWIAQLAFDRHRGWRRSDWNHRVDAAEFVDAFAGWTVEGTAVGELVARSDAVLEYPMVDRDPVEHWVHGSVVLVGDAAHPMYPLGSNGASEAIVDTAVLGASFVEHGVGRDALRAYESERLASVSALVLRNRRAGPFSVLGILDEECAGVLDHVGADTTPRELDRCLRRYQVLARATTEALNDAAPTIAPGARVADDDVGSDDTDP